MTARKARIELRPTVAAASPCKFAKRANTRIRLIIQKIVIDVGIALRQINLAPEIRLQPRHVTHLGLGETLLGEIERQHLLRIEYRRPVVTRLARGLTHVEIEIGPGHHHGRKPLARRLAACVDTLPSVNESLAVEAARIYRLVPHARDLAPLLDNSRHAVHEVLLQLGSAPDAARRHQRLAVGARHPLRGVHLVAADMYVARRKQLGQLPYHVIHQSVIALLGRAQYVAGVVTVRRLERGSVAAQHLGMHARQIETVPGQIYLGDYLYVAHGGVLDQLAHLLLRIVSAVTLVPASVTRRHGRVAAAESSDFGQLGMRLYLDAPCLVVRQMQVQFVDLVVRQIIDETFHFIELHPRAAHVEHESAIGETRLVDHAARADHHGRRQSARIHLRGQQLQQSLDAVLHPRCRSALDDHAHGAYVERIRLGGEIFIRFEHNISRRLPVMFMYRQREIFREVICRGAEFRVVCNLSCC